MPSTYYILKEILGIGSAQSDIYILDYVKLFNLTWRDMIHTPHYWELLLLLCTVILNYLHLSHCYIFCPPVCPPSSSQNDFLAREIFLLALMLYIIYIYILALVFWTYTTAHIRWAPDRSKALLYSGSLTHWKWHPELWKHPVRAGS